MGVQNLWQILGPVQRHQELSELKGQVLAVDLSIWVCETQCVKQMQGVVSKPFLRNLFFRILHLLQLGVRLVFVVEGEAPDLKKDTMNKRQEARFQRNNQGFKGPRGGAGKGSRRNFNACLRECCRMLDCLGVPYLHSCGEAEAFCATLDAAGLVDGCLTNDGDAFLYGARTVYRNFTMNTKDPHVESYCMRSIESCLGLDRQKLVAIALLLGCDYLPKGVPGVGVDKATKLLTTLQGHSVLDRFHKWRRMSDSECVDQIESIVRKKALALPDFPQVPVIHEFLTPKDKCPSAIKSWSRPKIAELQNFALDKMEWVVEYTLEKVLPLVTLWDMTFICKKGRTFDGLLQPIRVVKSRTRQGVQCYEVEWNKPETDTLSPQAVYTTIETQDFFSKCYPEIVKEFENLMAAKLTKGKSRKKKGVEHGNAVVESSQSLDEDLCEAVGNLSLHSNTEGSQPFKHGSSSLQSEEEKNAELSSQEHKDSEEECKYNTDGLESKIVRMEKKTLNGIQGGRVDTRKMTEDHKRMALTVDISKEKTQEVENQPQNGVSGMNRPSEESSVVMRRNQGSDLSDDESSEDEEQTYIPLSQRVQINLKGALNKKPAGSTKDKNVNTQSEKLDVSILCTMLGSGKGSTKQTITSNQQNKDDDNRVCNKLGTHISSKSTGATDRVCDSVKTYLSSQPNQLHQTKLDKSKMANDDRCALDTLEKSNLDQKLLNVEDGRQPFKEPLLSNMSLKSVSSLKSRKCLKSLKEQKSCVEHQDLKYSEISTKEEITIQLSIGLASTRDGNSKTRNRDLESCCTDRSQETCIDLTLDDPLPSGNSEIDSNSEPNVIQVKSRTSIDVEVVDTDMTTPLSGSGVPCDQQSTAQINLPDTSKLFPSVRLPCDRNSSPSCRQVFKTITDFSCVEKMNFSILTPTHCNTFNNHQMSCRDQGVSTPIGISKVQHDGQNDSLPVLQTPFRTVSIQQRGQNNGLPVQETPQKQASIHQPVTDKKSVIESPQSFLHCNESLNMTAIPEFGNFQIESSLFGYMNKSHQTSFDHSQDMFGDLSNNCSFGLKNNDTQNQQSVDLKKNETKDKKTCDTGNLHFLSKDKEYNVQGHHCLGSKDQEDCIACCEQGSANEHEYASHHVHVDDENRESMPCSHQINGKYQETHCNYENHNSDCTRMDGSVVFISVDSGDDHSPSKGNVKCDRRQDSVSFTNCRTTGLSDTCSKQRNKACPDIIISEPSDDQCSQTTDYSESKDGTEPTSTVPLTVGARTRHIGTLDIRQEENITTSYVTNGSPTLPSTKLTTDQDNFGEDSSISVSSHTPFVQHTCDRTPDLHKENMLSAVNQIANISIDNERSPVALADRLRSRLKKGGHSVLGDILDNQHNLGKDYFG